MGNFELKVLENWAENSGDTKTPTSITVSVSDFGTSGLLNDVLDTQLQTSVHKSPRVNLAEQVYDNGSKMLTVGGQLGDRLWNLINHR